MLHVGPLDNALVATGVDRSITYSTTAATTTVTDSGADIWRRGGDQATGHWTALGDAGQTIAVFNTGHTDVFVTDGTNRHHAVVADIPGVVGADSDSVYLLSGGSSKLDGKVTLHGVPLSGGSSQVIAGWYHHRGRGGWWFSEGSGIFSFQNRLFYLEELTPPGESWRHRGMELRLARVDPMDGDYESHRLGLIDRPLYDVANGVNRLAASARRGHLVGNSLYALNGAGELLRVDLEDRDLEVIADVSDAASSAEVAAAAWHESSLTVLFSDDRSSQFVLETYDLEDGTRTSVMDVEMPEAVRNDEALLLWSMAAPHR